MTMVEHEDAGGTRFGRTLIDAVVGELVEQPVQGILYPANSRGVMGAGSAGSLRFAAGPELEREAMAAAPLELGEAVATGSGKLVERGIQTVIHTVIAPGLGDTPRMQTVLRALSAALRLADRDRIRTIALPVLGVSAEAPQVERAEVARELVDAIVTHVRRPGSRLERIVIVSRFQDDLLSLDEAIQRARQRSWSSPA
jgi:O-acetyl-ADP-ribose deacetylase (regulator of RNase III)